MHCLRQYYSHSKITLRILSFSTSNQMSLIWCIRVFDHGNYFIVIVCCGLSFSVLFCKCIFKYFDSESMFGSAICFYFIYCNVIIDDLRENSNLIFCDWIFRIRDDFAKLKNNPSGSSIKSRPRKKISWIVCVCNLL